MFREILERITGNRGCSYRDFLIPNGCLVQFLFHSKGNPLQLESTFETNWRIVPCDCVESYSTFKINENVINKQLTGLAGEVSEIHSY